MGLGTYLTYDGVSVNDESGIFLYNPYDDPPRYIADVSYRSRVGQRQERESVSYPVLEQHFVVDRGPTVEHHEVMALFSRTGGERLLVGTDASSGATVQVMAEVVSFGRAGHPGDSYEGVFAIRGPMLETTLNEVSVFPATVGGNVDTLPVMLVEGGDLITRYRATIRDNTGEGLSSELVEIENLTVTSADTLVYVNGLSQPFYNTGSSLKIRVDCKPNEAVFADIWTGAAINNTTTADALDPAGINLDSSTMAALTYASWGIERHPLAATGAWRPGRIIKHANSRPYTFGTTDASIAEFTLVDRQVSGTRHDLPDNFDSAVMLSGLEMDSISNLDLEIFAGYAIDVTTETNTVQKATHTPNNTDNGAVSGGHLTLGLGSLTYTVAVADDTTGVSGHAVVQLAVEGLVGASNVNTTGSGSEDVTSFEFVGNLAGKDVELIRVVSNGLQAWGSDTNGTWGTISFSKDASGGQPAETEEVPGTIAAFVAAGHRDEQDYTEIWSQSLTGAYPEGTTETVSVPTLSLTGKHKLAVGLRAVSNQANNVNWGKVTIKGTPTVQRKATDVPTVTLSAAIPARLKDGVIHNTTTGERIILKQVLTDDVPLVIDCNGEELGDRGVKPETGPYYKIGVDRTNPATWFPLEPGSNDIDSPFTVTLKYRNAWEL